MEVAPCRRQEEDLDLTLGLPLDVLDFVASCSNDQLHFVLRHLDLLIRQHLVVAVLKNLVKLGDLALLQERSRSEPCAF